MRRLLRANAAAWELVLAAEADPEAPPTPPPCPWCWWCEDEDEAEDAPEGDMGGEAGPTERGVGPDSRGGEPARYDSAPLLLEDDDDEEEEEVEE